MYIIRIEYGTLAAVLADIFILYGGSDIDPVSALHDLYRLLGRAKLSRIFISKTSNHVVLLIYRRTGVKQNKWYYVAPDAVGAFLPRKSEADFLERKLLPPRLDK